ncbi:MAG: hypothetical protein EBR92_09385 [Alphaproteobacteria bacterium]|nr:hypothetical protein [Alphaproteobacteria bacterium]
MTSARIWTSLIVVCAGLMLASCQTAALKPPAKIFQAGDFKPLMINARRLEIVDNWTMPMADPHVGHRATPLPSNSLAAWASRVLQPAGGSGEMVFDIRKASITLTQLPLKTGLDGLFTDQENQKITAEIEAQIIWLEPVGGSNARVELRAAHHVTLLESATAGEVQSAIHESLNGAIGRLDGEARRELQKINRIILP